jgi:ATP-dependent DNA helicase DinG
VLWVDGTDDRPVLHVAPLDVSGHLQQGLFADHTVVLTSATLDAGLGERLGVDTRRLDVDSTFDHEAQALLYCAAHLPDPRTPGFEAAARAEVAELIRAAGGRTLALFTSWRAMKAAVEELRPTLPWTVLAQGDLPKPALLHRFANDVDSCLFATASFWQGVDVPGAALSLVTIDKLPFPRPDEPLAAARRERHGADGFRMVDLPRAATLLAQAAGRLIRTSTDRGVVAVLDRRLATSRSYRWDLVRALPPMRRTREPEEVRRFLRELAAPSPERPGTTAQ